MLKSMGCTGFCNPYREGGMRKILLIGIRPGNPDYLTIPAVDALNRVDVFFVPDKGAEKAALRQLREEISSASFARSDTGRLPSRRRDEAKQVMTIEAASTSGTPG